MRNFLFLFLFLFLLFMVPACVKNTACTPKSVTSEAAQIQNYASANSIAAMPHSSGLYYEIIDSGYGATPTLNSRIAITYTGMMLDGTIFDQRTTPNSPAWALSDLIEGWRIGIPLIKKGGRIKLIIPSALGYGCTGYGAIPGNAVLFFDITLVDVQ